MPATGLVVPASGLVSALRRLVGAAYLVWLGVQAIRHRRGFDVSDVGGGVGPALSTTRAIRQGFVVGFSNPKAFMILGAVLPQFVDRGAGHVQLQMLLLGLLAFGIGIVSDSLWAVIASQLRSWFNASPKRGEAMGVIGGGSMIALGVGLAATGNRQH
mgnify:CR=1 FL=1